MPENNFSNHKYPALFDFYLLHKKLIWRSLWLLVFLAGLGWVYSRLASMGMNYEWQWNRAWRQLIIFSKSGIKAGPLLDGILMTIGITVGGMFFSTIIGLGIAWMRLSSHLSWVLFAKMYVGLFRNTPLLLQLFFIYFLVAPVFTLDPLSSAILSLSAFEGAYMAEIFRAGILSINRTQWEGSLSLGFSLTQTLWLVILPQSFRNILPAFANQCVSVLKDSSLVSAIAVADLTMRAQAIVAETFLAFEVWLLVGAIYLILALFISLPGLWLEKSHQWQ